MTHDRSDGAWQILGESGIEGGGPELACLHHIVEKDPTLDELADLPKGWYPERTEPENLGNGSRMGPKKRTNEPMYRSGRVNSDPT